MPEFTAKDIYRASHTKRWGIVRTTRQQTLANHGYNVTMMSTLLLERIIPSHKPGQKLEMIEWALYHDIIELVHSDLPTPVKRFVEKRSPGVFEELERGMSDKYDKYKNAVAGTPFKAIVKIADIIDGIVFLHGEGMGTHAKQVEKKLTLYFIDLINQCKKDFDGCLWDSARDILEEALNGKDTILGFEFNGNI